MTFEEWWKPYWINSPTVSPSPEVKTAARDAWFAGQHVVNAHEIAVAALRTEALPQAHVAAQIDEYADNLETMADYVKDADSWRGAFRGLRKFVSMKLKAREFAASSRPNSQSNQGETK